MNKNITVRPVLVESKEPNNIYTLDGKLYQTTPNTNIVVNKTDKLIPQQLILISLEDERIEVGDRCYCSIENRIIINQCHTNVPLSRRKVVATQEQLSPELIQQLVDEYNNGGMKDFEIEMEEITDEETIASSSGFSLKVPINIKYLPKLNNGFVTIVEKLQMPKISADDLPLTNGGYNEEDMLQAFTAGEQYCLMQETSTPKNALPFDKWIRNYKKK